MQDQPLRLPSVVYDDGLSPFVTALGLYARESATPLVLDMQDVQFYTPGAVAGLLAIMHRWLGEGREVQLLNSEVAPAFSYLQRMDFFTLCGLKLPEHFRRHDAQGRFVTLRRIDSSLTGQVDTVAAEIARCLFPEQADSDNPDLTGPHDLVVYAATELINNVLQHARAPGFTLAQVYPQQHMVRLAIADYGIGIRSSFEENQPPFWDAAMSDLDALGFALEPKVSSKLNVSSGWWVGGGINAGVGLSILKELARDADGIFTLISQTGFYQSNCYQQHEYPSELTLPVSYPGTICSLQVSQSKLVNQQLILMQAKRRLGLLDKTHPFDDLFES
jgi:hypothetical protein